MEGSGDAKHVLVTLGKSTSGYQSWQQLLTTDVADMTVTHRVYMDIHIGGEYAGRAAACT
jgi:hypothetical protein